MPSQPRVGRRTTTGGSSGGKRAASTGSDARKLPPQSQNSFGSQGSRHSRSSSHGDGKRLPVDLDMVQDGASHLPTRRSTGGSSGGRHRTTSGPPRTRSNNSAGSGRTRSTHSSSGTSGSGGSPRLPVPKTKRIPPTTQDPPVQATAGLTPRFQAPHREDSRGSHGSRGSRNSRGSRGARGQNKDAAYLNPIQSRTVGIDDNLPPPPPQQQDFHNTRFEIGGAGDQFRHHARPDLHVKQDHRPLSPPGPAIYNFASQRFDDDDSIFNSPSSRDGDYPSFLDDAQHSFLDSAQNSPSFMDDQMIEVDVDGKYVNVVNERMVEF